VDIECAGRKVSSSCLSLQSVYATRDQRPAAFANSCNATMHMLNESYVSDVTSTSICHSTVSRNNASRAGYGLRIPPCSTPDTQSPALSVTVSTQGHFPEADKDSVIQIASLVSVHGQTEPAVKNIITLNTCSSIVGAEVPACASALSNACFCLARLGTSAHAAGILLRLRQQYSLPHTLYRARAKTV